MDNLADFLVVTRGAADSTPLGLDSNNSIVTTRSGRAARWVSNHRTAENVEVTRRFLAALGRTYGAGIADNLAKKSSLGQLLETGKPLQARVVRDSVAQADVMKVEIRRVNAQVASMFAALPESETGKSYLVSTIEAAAKRLEPPNPRIVAQIDMGAISREIEQAILRSGRNPDREIGLAEAARIVEEVAHRAVIKALARGMGTAAGSQGPDAATAVPANPGDPLKVNKSAGVAQPDAAAVATRSAPQVNPYDAQMKGTIDRKLADSAYESLPGGRALAEEIGRHADLVSGGTGGVQPDAQEEAQGTIGRVGYLPVAERHAFASAAIRAAEIDVFLSGYGVRTLSGQRFESLQQTFDQHPMVQIAERQWDVKMNASALSWHTCEAFSNRLAARLSDALTRPEELPAEDAPVKERVARAVSETAEDMVGDFMTERAEQLLHLVKSNPEDKFPIPLAQIFFHRSTPAENSFHLLSLPLPELRGLAGALAKHQ
ncbi:MAG: hypothetical protein OXE40_14885 [Gammaproteobacteria bacterium]|nr:hypothetical protein [Gammaproteobacteria bacterium]